MLELASQIKKYVNFYYGHASHEYFSFDGKIEKIILSGEGAALKGLPEFLSSELRLPVRLGNPIIHIIQKNGRQEIIPPSKILSFTTALGLALQDTLPPNH